jgi:hypothetical protein
MRTALGVSVLFLLALAGGRPSSASAYCRTRTVKPVASSCPEACQTEGLPLYWPTRELGYLLNERGLPDLPTATVREILEESFGAWQAVRCEDGEPIGLSIEQLPGFSALAIGPQLEEPNDNVIVHIPADEWDDDPHAFAITKLWFRRHSGHIIGADMALNGAMDPFGICPEGRGCVQDELADLRNVVTHEAGHFLGLGHSDDPDATMWCDAAPGDVDKRDLSADDAAGLCNIYGPNARPDPDAASAKLSRRARAGCSLSPYGRATRALAGFSALLLWVLASRLAARRGPDKCAET